MATRKWRLPLHIPVAVLFSLLILGVGATISLYHFNETRRLLDGANHALFQNLADDTREVLLGANDSVRRLFMLLSASPLADARNAAERLQHLPEITGLLGAAPLIESVMVGYGNGDLFLVRRPHPGARPPEADAKARWIVLDVPPRECTPHQAHEHAFDAGLRHLGMRVPKIAPPEPRLSDWYRLAASTNGLVVTPPRPFAHAPGHGPSFAQRNGATVFAVNVDLSAMSALLRTRARTASTEARLLARDRSVLASSAAAASEGDGVILAALADYREVAVLSRQLAVADERPWHVSMAPMPGFGSEDWILAVATPDDELFAEAYRQRERSIVFTVAAVLLSFPLAWGLSRLLTIPLHRLADQAYAVSALRFDARSQTGSVILEVDQLADAMALMSGAIARFLEMGHRLGSARELEAVLEQVALGAREVSGASVSAVHVWDEGPGRGGDTTAGEVAASDGSLTRDPAGLLSEPWTQVAREAEGPFSFRRDGPEGLQKAVCVPLRTPEGEALGALALAAAQGSPLTAAPAEVTGFLVALAGSAAVALENQRLLAGRRALLHGVIRMVAEAIDAKSPYTGGHCRRVPVIALRLARAASASQAPALHDFRLSPSDWEALEIASWLHDCGKLTTPEYVVDKATKLETLYNRIHEIRTRFEVLKRDAEIAYWRGLAAGGEETALRRERDRAWHTLDGEFAFVAQCNRGGEDLPPASIARLERIAQRRWSRTIDDRLGLSRAELARRADEPLPSLPAEASLLQDCAHHVVPRPDCALYAEGNPWGFTMRAPARLYNHGELYNLSIRRGTLTREERFKIREHIVETMVMLSRLPFPRDLATVPEMACAHHETMDGRGYPRGLRGEQMSGAARVIAIADIFEALTATDRPYKDANSVAEALSLMREMAARREIDADLFALFAREAPWWDRDAPSDGGAEDGLRETDPAPSGPPAVTNPATQASFP